MGKIKQAIVDFFYRTKIKIQLFFTSDQNKRKDLLIAYVLFTTYGRRRLAEAMVNPIRESLNYASIGRRLFAVQELPSDRTAYAAYTNVSYVEDEFKKVFLTMDNGIKYEKIGEKYE